MQWIMDDAAADGDPVAKGLSALSDLRHAHIGVVDRLLRSAGDQMYTVHAVLLAMMQRSYDVCSGFESLVAARNLSSAAPLVRLQLDTLVRASYVLRSPDPDRIASQVVSGVEFRHMRDEKGRGLLDGHLVDLAAEHHPWIRDLYRDLSGWVHLSPWHVQAAFGVETSPGIRTITIPIDPQTVSTRVWLELTEAIGQATRLLLQYVASASEHIEGLAR